MTATDIEMLILGLKQIPREGLERLRDHIDAGKPMLIGTNMVVEIGGDHLVY